MSEHTYTVSIRIRAYTIEQEDGGFCPALETIVNGGLPTQEILDLPLKTMGEACACAQVWAYERGEITKRSLDNAVERLEAMFKDRA